MSILTFNKLNIVFWELSKDVKRSEQMNIVENINNLGFELVKLVRQAERKVESKPLKGSAKESGIGDWTNKKPLNMVHRTPDNFGQTIQLFVSYGDCSFGISKDDFNKVKDIRQLFNELKKFQGKSSTNFLEENIVKWAVKLNREGRYENSLFEFVEKSLDIAIKDCRFSFPIYNIDIEVPFKIGDVEITYFTKSELDAHFSEFNKKKKQLTKEEFNEFYRDFHQGQVVARVLVNAESERAEEIAKYKAGLAVDVLKCFGYTMINPTKETKFDIDFKLNFHFTRSFLIEVPDIETPQFSLSYSANIDRFTFEEKMYLYLKDYTLKSISDFLISKKNDELHNLIKQSIGFLGSALSTKDMHFRIIQLFTIIESLILEDVNDKSIGKKTKNRIAKLFTDDEKSRQKIKELIDEFYYVRNKMIHKALRLEIDIQNLSKFQILVFETLLKYIAYTEKYTSKNEIINEINAKIF